MNHTVLPQQTRSTQKLGFRPANVQSTLDTALKLKAGDNHVWWLRSRYPEEVSSLLDIASGRLGTNQYIRSRIVELLCLARFDFPDQRSLGGLPELPYPEEQKHRKVIVLKYILGSLHSEIITMDEKKRRTFERLYSESQIKFDSNSTLSEIIEEYFPELSSEDTTFLIQMIRRIGNGSVQIQSRQQMHKAYGA